MMVQFRGFTGLLTVTASFVAARFGHVLLISRRGWGAAGSNVSAVDWLAAKVRLLPAPLSALQAAGNLVHS